MATAWTILTNNSAITSGTAWDHLNNPSGEGGGGDTIIVDAVNGWRVEMNPVDTRVRMTALDATAELKKLDLDVELNLLDVDDELPRN